MSVKGVGKLKQSWAVDWSHDASPPGNVLLGISSAKDAKSRFLTQAKQ